MNALSFRPVRRVAPTHSSALGAHRAIGALGALAVAFALSAYLASTAPAASLNFIEPLSSPEATGRAGYSITAADLDGDADRDLALANPFSDDVTILKNMAASGNFFQPVSSPVSGVNDPHGIIAADLDGDGDQDLAVINRVPFNQVTILLNDGEGIFSEAASSPEPVGSDPRSIIAADLDGDADLDLAVTNRASDNVTILKNNGAGAFFEPHSSPEPVGRRPRYVAAADLDADGDQDLAVTNAFSDDVTILKNMIGSGNFFEPASSPEPAGDGPVTIAAADLDLDGDGDLVVGNYDQSYVTILGNSSTGSFFEPPSSPEAAHRPISIAVADLDADGDPDIAATSDNAGSVTVLKNR